MRKLLVTVVVLGALVVGADRGGAYGVGALAGHNAATKSGAHDAHVTIHGVPFLTQVARGRLGHVTVDEDGISSDGLTIDHLHADAYGVHLSASDVIRGREKPVPIDRVTGSAVITYAALTTSVTRQLGLSTGLTLAFTARDQGDLTATVTGPLKLHLSFDLPVPTVSDGKLQLGGLVERIAPLLPDQVASLIAIPLPSLPYGLRLSSASAQDDGVHFAVTGSDVSVGP